jgi:hypothetical protein
VQKDKTFDDYHPAYRYGWESASRPENQGRRFDEIENDLSRGWQKARGTATHEWNDVKHATRDAYERIHRPNTTTTPGMTTASEK